MNFCQKDPVLSYSGYMLLFVSDFLGFSTSPLPPSFSLSPNYCNKSESFVNVDFVPVGLVGFRPLTEQMVT